MNNQFPELERLLHKAMFFPGLNARIASLSSLLRIVDTQLEAGRAEEIGRLRKKHKKFGKKIHAEDKAFDLDELENQITHYLPKLFRGGFVLTLWSVLERSLMDITQKAATHTGVSLPEDYFRKGSFFPTMRDAIQQCSGVSAFTNSAEYKKLRLLAAVRQTLMHHDGRLNEAPPILKKMSRTELDLIGLIVEKTDYFEFIIPTEAFLSENTNLVSSCTQRIATQVYEKLNPSIGVA